MFRTSADAKHTLRLQLLLLQSATLPEYQQNEVIMARTTTASQPPGSTPSAKQAALRTYELVEAIILSLPPSDIVLAAAVNQTWCAIATTSPAINFRLREIAEIPQSADETEISRIVAEDFLNGDPRRSGTLEPPWEYSAHLDTQQCCVTIPLDKANLFIRRLGNTEIKAVLPKQTANAATPPKPIVVKGGNKRVTIISWHQMVKGKKDMNLSMNYWGRPRKDTRKRRQEIQEWEFEFRGNDEVPVWRATVTPESFPHDVQVYLKEFYG